MKIKKKSGLILKLINKSHHSGRFRAIHKIHVGLDTKCKLMTEDKNLYTEKVPAGKRTYFLDVMENHKGHKFIKFTESRANEGEYIRQSLRIFQEDFDKIFEALDKVKGFIHSSANETTNS